MFWQLIDLYSSAVENFKVEKEYTEYGSFLGDYGIKPNFCELILNDSKNKTSNLIDLCDEVYFYIIFIWFFLN